MSAASTLAALALLVATTTAPTAPTTMPLVEVPVAAASAAGRHDTLVIFYSGDGGWADFDRRLAAGFARQGVPTVGVNSLRYFWTRRSPDEAATDLAATARRYMAAWGKSRVLLVGFSFGADALPLITPRLPADLRARLRGVALIGPGRTGELQFHPGSWLDRQGAEATPLAPLLTRLQGVPALCIYGDHDAGSACGGFRPDLIRSMKVPGGHHLGGDLDDLAQAILKADA